MGPMQSHTEKMSEGCLCKVCEGIGTDYTCMNSWKEPFNPYNSSIWIFSLFRFFKQISGLLSIEHYRSLPSADAILVFLVIQKKFIELWTNLKRKSSLSYERIKNKQMTVFLSNQKARKRYTLILLELLENNQ